MDSFESLRTQLDRLEELYHRMQTSQVDKAWLDLYTKETSELGHSIATLKKLLKVSRAERENRLLKEIGLRLLDDLDPESLAHLIMDALADLMRYDAAGLYFIDATTGTIRWETLRGYATDKLHLVRQKLDRGIMGWVRNQGKPVIVSDVRADDRYFNARDRTLSELVVPIHHDGRMIGFFNLESDQLDSYDEHDRQLLEVFAGQVAQSVEHALQKGLKRDQQRVKAELKVARHIQLSLQPKGPIEADTLSVGGLNLSSHEVGGDYFDHFEISDRDTGIVIADVAGKGVPAGLLMASFRTGLRILAQHRTSICDIMSCLNDHLAEVTDPDTFVTTCYGVYHKPTGRFSYVNAGHNPPLLQRAADNSFERLTEGGMIVGSFEGLDFEMGTVDLAVGDRILFYTDGLNECLNHSGEELGEAGIMQAMRDTKGESLSRALLGIVELARNWSGMKDGSLRFADDLTVMLLVRNS